MSERWDKWVAQLIIRAGLLSVMERLESGRENVLRILVYHRIARPEAEMGRFDPALLSATPALFAQQMRFLVEHYHVLSIADLLSALTSGQPLPPRSVMVTFDDGYRGFLDTAWPVLQSLQIPAILFVATDYLSADGRSFWWDQLYRAFSQTEREDLRLPSVGSWSLRGPEQRMKVFAEVKGYMQRVNHHRAMSLVEEILETLGVPPRVDRTVLTWQDVRHLCAGGLYVGAHTRSHPILSRVTLKEARQEIIGSQQDLSRELGQAWPVFAYPSGHPADLCPELISVLHEEGFQAAMTMIEGHNVLRRTHPLCFKRVGMASHLSMAEFRLVLTGVYNIYGTWQSSPFRRGVFVPA
jgi:peptidoglycan/xylan/chitin deacetylase (PgdA/CDA1 family)